MGVTADMSPKIVALNPSGRVTYVLDTNNANITQVQLAVPVTDVFFINEQGKSMGLCESPVLLADISAEGINWLANNVIVFVSQPQEIIVVDSVPDSDVARQWHSDSATAINALTALTQFLTNILSQANGEEESSETIDEDSHVDIYSPESQNAKKWVEDSAISAAALSSLKTYLHTHLSSKT